MDRTHRHEAMTAAGTWRSVGFSALRAGLAAALAAASFIALREKYRGDCLFLDWQMWTFMLFFAGLFLVCFVWFVAELVHPVAMIGGASTAHSILTGAAIGIAIYSSVALVTWYLNPVPHDSGPRDSRMYLSALWTMGLLQEAGNYSSEFCGY